MFLHGISGSNIVKGNQYTLKFDLGGSMDFFYKLTDYLPSLQKYLSAYLANGAASIIISPEGTFSKSIFVNLVSTINATSLPDYITYVQGGLNAWSAENASTVFGIPVGSAPKFTYVDIYGGSIQEAKLADHKISDQWYMKLITPIALTILGAVAVNAFVKKKA